MKIKDSCFFYSIIIMMFLLTACSNTETRREVESIGEEKIPPIEEPIVDDSLEVPLTCGQEDCDQEASNANSSE